MLIETMSLKARPRFDGFYKGHSFKHQVTRKVTEVKGKQEKVRRGSGD